MERIISATVIAAGIMFVGPSATADEQPEVAGVNAVYQWEDTCKYGHRTRWVVVLEQNAPREDTRIVTPWTPTQAAPTKPGCDPDDFVKLRSPEQQAREIARLERAVERRDKRIDHMSKRLIRKQNRIERLLVRLHSR